MRIEIMWNIVLFPFCEIANIIRDKLGEKT